MRAKATRRFTAQYGDQVHTVEEGDVLEEPLASYLAETGAPVEPLSDDAPQPKAGGRGRKTT